VNYLKFHIPVFNENSEVISYNTYYQKVSEGASGNDPIDTLFAKPIRP
jgi:hypothetical protein